MTAPNVRYLVVHELGEVPIGFPLEDPVPTVRRWHTDPPPAGRGWSDIAYEKIVTPAGKALQGRPDNIIGAHAFGLNSYSLGILVVGDFRKKGPPLPQKHALVQVLASLCKRYKLTPDRIIGHRDVCRMPEFTSDPYTTECPGDALYGLLPAIRKEVQGYL